jgi:hypothetical protein
MENKRERDQESFPSNAVIPETQQPSVDFTQHESGNIDFSSEEGMRKKAKIDTFHAETMLPFIEKLYEKTLKMHMEKNPHQSFEVYCKALYNQEGLLTGFSVSYNPFDVYVDDETQVAKKA